MSVVHLQSNRLALDTDADRLRVHAAITPARACIRELSAVRAFRGHRQLRAAKA